MRLITYNILDGAIRTLPEITKIVQNEKPDYLTLNEANTFANENSKILKQFARETGFPYFDIALSGEHNYHVAVFSKYPFKEIHKLQPLARACFIGLIDSPLGELSVASLHLTPASEDKRNPEIDLIVSFQNRYGSRILTGDMNSLSRYDEYDQGMIKDFNEVQIGKFTTEGKLRFDAIDKILSAGYFDAAVQLKKNKERTVPTPVNKDIAHAQMRLDYFFLSHSLLTHLEEYAVLKNDLTNKASDHYPILVELR